MNKSSLVYQKKKAVSKFYCDQLIDYFESRPKGAGCHSENGETRINRSHKNSVDCAFSLHNPLVPLSVVLARQLNISSQEMCKTYRGLGYDYGKGWGVDDMSNIQKYYPTQGYTTEHCEWGLDEPFHRRILAWMVYLNDVTDKGGTHFPNQGITLKPRTGDLYIWPAYFTHTHCGIPSPTQIKYIATGWYSFLL